MAEGAFYRAMWRWHFYAGLIVLPVLALMAVTGALYLYKPEIEAMLYPVRVAVRPERPALAPSVLVTGVMREGKVAVTQVTRPAAPDESWRITTMGKDGRRTVHFVDPHDGRILGEMHDGGLMGTIKNLHSLALTGPIGNRLVEVVAGWAILLCITGLYLRWPRRGRPAMALRGRASGRLFWRDLHGTLGFASAIVILFLAVTGMPWTDVWGGGLRAVVAANNLGRPKMAVIPWTASAREALPWSLQKDGVAPGKPGDIGIDQAMRIAQARGISGGYTMIMPSAPAMPYLAVTTVVRAQDARAITLDAGSGAVVQDIDWRHFGFGARSVEWGIATHQGQQYGTFNRLIMLAGCLCLLMLCMTAPILWWKRRQDGRLAPPPESSPTARRTVAGLMLAIGLLFPLTGLSMVVAMAGEWFAGRFRTS